MPKPTIDDHDDASLEVLKSGVTLKSPSNGGQTLLPISETRGQTDRPLPLSAFDFMESEEFAVSEHVGWAMAEFENIVVPTPQQMSSVHQMNSIRVMGLKQPAGQTRRGARYLHPSGSGKSTCARIIAQYLSMRYGDDPNRKPVLHVTLSTTGTPRSLGSSILTEAGENYSSRGDADLLLTRVREAIYDFKVELLIIDELNHIKGKAPLPRRQTLSRTYLHSAGYQ